MACNYLYGTTLSSFHFIRYSWCTCSVLKHAGALINGARQGLQYPDQNPWAGVRGVSDPPAAVTPRSLTPKDQMTPAVRE